MFAGEGSPERTNHRFHYLSQGMTSIRLSTAFDSVTLYGRDPHKRPDIYGKIGNNVTIGLGTTIIKNVQDNTSITNYQRLVTK